MAVTIVGVVLLAAAIDVLVPSASAKWALLAPMLMSVGIAPELTQAAFRIGDGPVNMVRRRSCRSSRWCWRSAGAT